MHLLRAMIDVIKGALRDFWDDHALQLAAGLSYYTFFALPPLLILITMIAGQIWDPQDVRGLLVREFEGAVGAEAATQIEAMIGESEESRSRGLLTTLLSVGALAFGATGAFGQLQVALNTAWGVKENVRRGHVLSIVTKRLISFGMILVIVFLLLVSLVVSALLAAAGEVIASIAPTGVGEVALWATNLGLSFIVIAVLFMFIYKVLPDARMAWSDVFRGGLATAALFLGGEYLLGLYIARSDPGSAFGAAGSLAVILLWIYYSAVIFLLGAEFTQVYADRRGHGIRPDRDAIRIGE